MYGQARKKDYEVKLVRISPWDDRVYRGNQNSKSRKTAERVLTVVMTVLFTLSACLGVAYFCFLPDEEEIRVVSESEILSSGPEAEPAAASETELVVLEEPEPKIPVIAIDPGHGGDDDGCVRGDVLEKEINLEIAMRLAVRLQDMGFDVVLTREDNQTSLTLEERVSIAEESGADIYISIHQNASEEQESSARGVETWYCDRMEGSRRLAQLVHRGAIEKTAAWERELCESSDLYVIRETSMPSCLIETSFLSNSEERKLICDSVYQDELVEGIAEGIYYYFNPKTMYLTFDDGPSEENTSAVLDILKEHDIKATFL